MTFKGKPVDAKAIGKELGVRYHSHPHKQAHACGERLLGDLRSLSPIQGAPIYLRRTLRSGKSTVASVEKTGGALSRSMAGLGPRTNPLRGRAPAVEVEIRTGRRARIERRSARQSDGLLQQGA